MSTELCHYSTGHNWVSEMLDLIERAGPRMMICGGGAIAAEELESHKRMTAQEVDQMIGMHRRGRTSQEIADFTGRAVSTVDRAIRPYRQRDRRRRDQ